MDEPVSVRDSHLGGLSGLYETSLRVQQIVHYAIPGFGAPFLLVATLLLRNLDGLRWWVGVVASTAVAATNTIASAWAKRRDDLRAVRLEGAIAQARADTEKEHRRYREWKRQFDVMSILDCTMTELVSEKSDQYKECAKKKQPHKEAVARSVRQVLSVAYELACEVYRGGQSALKPKIVLSFFTCPLPKDSHSQRSLILRFCFPAASLPDGLELDTPHPNLAHDGWSTAATAWRQGHLIVIPNTEEELTSPRPRFVKFKESDQFDTRSIVAYPVFDRDFLPTVGATSSLIGVICVSADRKDIFQERDSEMIEHVLRTFAARIVFAVRRFALGRLLEKTPGEPFSLTGLQ